MRGAWIGKTVEVKLVNRPTGWNCEGAVWRDICVRANGAND